MIEQKRITALYVRVSTVAQAEEGYSIPAQIERLKCYCNAQGWKNTVDYIDAGYSGSKLERPKIQELINDAKEGKIERVVVFKLDRLSRSQKDTLYLIEDVFEKNNVGFISINESFDTGTPIGKAMIGLLSVFAQLERENIYIRTREGMRKRAMNGYWRGGGNPPYAYRYNPATNELIVIPEEAEKVKQVFDLYIEGKSANYIAEELGFKSDVAVSSIIKHSVYKGYVTFKGNEYPGNHEAIVSEEIFDIAQEKRKERSNNKTSTENNIHLLSGLMFCGICGAKYRYINWGSGRYKLMCYSKDKSKYKTKIRKSDNCDSPNIWADELEALVLNDLFGLKLDGTNSKIASVNSDKISILNENLKRQEIAIRNLYTLYSKKPDNRILKMIDDVTDEIDRINEQLKKEQEVKSKNDKNKKVIEQINKMKKVWNDLSDKKKQLLLRECIDRIEIKYDEINILYKFEKLDLSIFNLAA